VLLLQNAHNVRRFEAGKVLEAAGDIIFDTCEIIRPGQVCSRLLQIGWQAIQSQVLADCLTADLQAFRNRLQSGAGGPGSKEIKYLGIIEHESIRSG